MMPKQIQKEIEKTFVFGSVLHTLMLASIRVFDFVQAYPRK